MTFFNLGHSVQLHFTIGRFNLFIFLSNLRICSLDKLILRLHMLTFQKMFNRNPVWITDIL